MNNSQNINNLGSKLSQFLRISNWYITPDLQRIKLIYISLNHYKITEVSPWSELSVNSQFTKHWQLDGDRNAVHRY